jgi:hypothetical protein
MKAVSIETLQNDLLLLSSLVPRVRDGALKGAVVRIEPNGRWSTEAPGFLLPPLPRGDLVLESDLGPIVLKHASITHAQLGPGGAIEGVSTQVILETSGACNGQSTFRAYVKTRRDFPAVFPLWLEDTAGARRWCGHLPLATKDGRQLDVFTLPNQSCVVLECSHPGLTLVGFRELTAAAQRLLEWLAGERLDGETCEVERGEDGRLIQAAWYGGHQRGSHIYAAIPCTWQEWTGAVGKLGLAPSLTPLNPVTLSSCLTKLLEEPGLVTCLRYLLAFPNEHLDIRGALLSVALESLTNHLHDKGLLESVRLVDADAWTRLRRDLLAVVDTASIGWDPRTKDALKSRVGNVNGPTNKDKLTKPFALLGVPLSDEEASAIDERNTFLHEGRFAPSEPLSESLESWTEGYQTEMRLFTAINKLLLKYLRYSGPMIDWGKRDIDGGTDNYILL